MKKRLETLVKLGIFATIAMYFANKFVESSALLRKTAEEITLESIITGHKVVSITQNREAARRSY